MNKENSSSLKFYELFQNKNERKLTDYRCEFCNQRTKNGKQEIEYDFKAISFLVLRLCGIWKNKILLNKIQDFDPDNIFIPGDQSKFKFILKAAIHYTPLGSNNGIDYKCGHYVCWKKEQNGWLEISDSTSTFHENFLKNLQGVYLLFLEKIEQTP